MAKFRVYNMHPHGFTHKEVFKGDTLIIPAGKYILMDYEDAVQFRGQYFPMKMDAMGKPDPESWKVIKIEAHEEIAAEKEVKKFVCPVDGRTFSTEKEMNDYIELNFGHLERVKDEALDEELAREASSKKKKAFEKEKTL